MNNEKTITQKEWDERFAQGIQAGMVAQRSFTYKMIEHVRAMSAIEEWTAALDALKAEIEAWT